MRIVARASVLALLVALLASPAFAQPAPPPTTATDIPHADFMTVLKSMNPDGVSDQQIKVVDIGKYNVADANGHYRICSRPLDGNARRPGERGGGGAGIELPGRRRGIRVSGTTWF